MSTTFQAWQASLERLRANKLFDAAVIAIRELRDQLSRMEALLERRS
ncbi:hypothetical protein [Halomonas sp. 11-S5]|nr:hypothetical protein [Halomonas sp. 11-S5]